MGTKLRKVVLSVLIAGVAAVVVAPPAEANRGNGTTTTTTTEPSYVPPYGQPTDLPDEPDPYANPVVAPTVVPVDLPAATDPNAGLAGGGSPLGPAPVSDDGQGGSESAPTPAPVAAEEHDGFMGGVLSRTGAETLPLARAGLAVTVLGLGLVTLARRRRVDGAAA